MSESYGSKYSTIGQVKRSTIRHGEYGTVGHLRRGVLVMIPYPPMVGFAIGRLIAAFYDVGVTPTGDPRHMLFAFSRTAPGACPDLPAGFGNVVAFNHRDYSDAELERLATEAQRAAKAARRPANAATGDHR